MLPAGSGVEVVERDRLVFAARVFEGAASFPTPNDPFLYDLYHLEAVNALEAWNITTGRSSVSVCVVDSGIDNQ